MTKEEFDAIEDYRDTAIHAPIRVVDHKGDPVKADGAFFASVPVDRTRLLAHFRPTHAGHGLVTKSMFKVEKFRTPRGDAGGDWVLLCPCGEAERIRIGEIDRAFQDAIDKGGAAEVDLAAAIGPVQP